MLAHGFTVELLVELCVAERAMATPERMVAGGRTIEVAQMRIHGLGAAGAGEGMTKMPAEGIRNAI